MGPQDEKKNAASYRGYSPSPRILGGSHRRKSPSSPCRFLRSDRGWTYRRGVWHCSLLEAAEITEVIKLRELQNTVSDKIISPADLLAWPILTMDICYLLLHVSAFMMTEELKCKKNNRDKTPFNHVISIAVTLFVH